MGTFQKLVYSLTLFNLLFSAFEGVWSSQEVDASQNACEQLMASSVPSFHVAAPGTPQYANDISHTSPIANQNSACSIEPSSSAEIVQVLSVINKTRTAWAVKGGGHNWNPGFASTPGVQLSMSLFNSTVYNSSTNTVTIGAGTTWDTVYSYLDPLGVNVIGGRIFGVGVGGFTLGGGFSYKSSQYGLGSDNVISYDLVTYSGQTLTVTAQSNKDLFFALQGGLNNAGIVTSFTVKAYPQTLVVAGSLVVSSENLSAFKKAIYDFSKSNKDTKAIINPLFQYAQGQVSGFSYILYDGPNLPQDTFKDFIALGANLKQQKFIDFIVATRDQGIQNRTLSHSVPVTGYSLEFLNTVANETQTQGDTLSSRASFQSLTIVTEVFLQNAFAHGRDSAYPHSKDHPWNPMYVSAVWTDAADDKFFGDQIRSISNTVQAAAVKLRLSTQGAIIYNNYALFDTPLKLLYGNNVKRLDAIVRKYDPLGILQLTGGFKVTGV